MFKNKIVQKITGYVIVVGLVVIVTSIFLIAENRAENNFAFIDAQNLNLGVKSLGWNLDFNKFRVYLKEKYGVSTADLLSATFNSTKTSTPPSRRRDTCSFSSQSSWIRMGR